MGADTPASRSLIASSTRATAIQVAPASTAVSGDRDVTVAVAVCFDHGTDKRRADEVAQHTHILCNRVQVDLYVRRSHHA